MRLDYEILAKLIMFIFMPVLVISFIFWHKLELVLKDEKDDIRIKRSKCTGLLVAVILFILLFIISMLFSMHMNQLIIKENIEGVYPFLILVTCFSGIPLGFSIYYLVQLVLLYKNKSIKYKGDL